MNNHLVGRLAMLCSALALLAALPAHADVTITGHYTFVNGDTTSRASYFTSRRVRVSTPDGREVIFDSKLNRVTLIDHQRRIYWDGSAARADSIIDVTDGSRWDFMLKHATEQLKAEWDQAMDIPPDSIMTNDGFKTKTIAGYPCNRWTERAGAYTTFERWTAAGLAPVDTYSKETEDVVLGAVLDPIARAVMSMFWDFHSDAGPCLAATMTFNTPTQHGSFNWEAFQVSDARIPASAWLVPAGYQRAKLSIEIPADVTGFLDTAPIEP